MRTVETLQAFEIIVAEVVHRHHIAFAYRVDAFHPPEIHLIAIDVPIHGLEEDVNTMVIIMERPVAEVLFGTKSHHLASLVVVTKSYAVVIKGIHFCSYRVHQINTQGDVVRHQKLIHRHEEAWRLHPHDFPTSLTEMENRLFANTSKHIHLVAHHADATFKVDVLHQVGDGIIGTIRFHSRKHRFFVGRIHENLVFKATEDILMEMRAFMENGRVNGIFRAAKVELVEVGQGDIDFFCRNVEARPVGATSHTFPAVAVKIIHTFGVLQQRLILLRHQGQGAVDAQFELLL